MADNLIGKDSRICLASGCVKNITDDKDMWLAWYADYHGEIAHINIKYIASGNNGVVDITSSLRRIDRMQSTTLHFDKLDI